MMVKTVKTRLNWIYPLSLVQPGVFTDANYINILILVKTVLIEYYLTKQSQAKL